MNITARRRDNVLVLQPTGRFDAHSIDDFRALLASNRRQERDEVAVDLNEVEFVDESVLAALAEARSDLRGSDGDLVLASPSQSVRIILELTGRFDDFVVVPHHEMAGGTMSGLWSVA
ncbi:MAG: STAS domain-containing protein [Acidimicrobiia bacterium]|nr:STAS domain-containing protein [Acidimicrobiia bacterium]